MLRNSGLLGVCQAYGFRDIGVFFDWASLFQKDPELWTPAELVKEEERTEDEQRDAELYRESRRPYTRADDQYLWANRNEPVEQLAKALGLGPKSCEARLKRLRDEGHHFGVCEEALSDAKETALRPARDVIQRILHDPALSVSDFVVGYRDRFETATLECPFDAPNESIRGRERSMVAALPEHRIEYFVYRGQLIWHKGQRLG